MITMLADRMVHINHQLFHIIFHIKIHIIQKRKKKSNFEVFEDEYWKEKARLAARRVMGLI